MSLLDWLQSKGFLSQTDTLGIRLTTEAAIPVFILLIIEIFLLLLYFRDFFRALACVYLVLLTFGISTVIIVLKLGIVLINFTSVLLGFLSVFISVYAFRHFAFILIFFKYLFSPNQRYFFTFLLIAFLLVQIISLFNLPILFDLKSVENGVTRLDPSYFFGSFTYTFPRWELFNELSLFGFFGSISILIDSIYKIRNFSYLILFLISYFSGLLPIFYLLILLIPLIDLNKEKKILLLIFQSLVPEKFASTIESYGNILPLSVFERLFEPYFVGVVPLLLVFSLVTLVKEVSLFSLLLLVSVASTLDSAMFNKKALLSQIQLQDYPRRELWDNISEVNVGNINLSSEFLRRLENLGILLTRQDNLGVVFKLKERIFINNLRINWGSRFRHPILLEVQCDDNKSILNFRRLYQGFKVVKSGVLTGITLNINNHCQKIAIMDCCKKFEFPFEIISIQFD